MGVVHILHRIGGSVLYSADIENNSLRTTLEEAVLNRADLEGADLEGAHLEGADLEGADLHGAHLEGAHLHGADLEGADLEGTHLHGAHLEGQDVAIARLSIVPEYGGFYGYKRCRNDVIVLVYIPDSAQRSNATGRKCRAAFVDVIAVDGAEEGVSLYSESVVYRVGERVTCDVWSSDRWAECGGGIHFFLTKIEAEDYR